MPLRDSSVQCVVTSPPYWGLRDYGTGVGSGTVGKVCERLGRRWVGLELSEDYIGIAQQRTAQMGLMYA
jgi:DNA modification methylase